jgi:hypothetical protein
MTAGKITAKLRDAVPVHFFEESTNRIMYRNIDIPDTLKTLEIQNFGFDVSAEGAITFRLYFNNGILPAEFPPIREKMTRAQKAAAKTAKTEEADDGAIAEESAAAEEPTGAEESEVPEEAVDAEESETAEEYAVTEESAAEDTADDDESEAAEVEGVPPCVEYDFAVTGKDRKALVEAISGITGHLSEYKRAPSYAYFIGDYVVDKTGILHGEATPEMLEALAEKGFVPR